jgi:hypothetical protein
MKWCRHIKWKPWQKKWWVLQGWLHVQRSWRVCPICGAERPTKANRNAAELRAAMDNDQ